MNIQQQAPRVVSIHTVWLHMDMCVLVGLKELLQALVFPCARADSAGEVTLDDFNVANKFHSAVQTI